MAVGASLFTPSSLEQAVTAMGFVQYDPIRSPSRAQDLILHQRVRNYRHGDLSRAYPQVGLEEGYLHVYGVMTRQLSTLVDPRAHLLHPDDVYAPSGLAADVLAMVEECGAVHPREVALRLGNARVVNAWGGISSATTRVLDELHRHWLVRVVRRDKGIKVYGPARPPAVDTPDRAECDRRMTLHVARTLMPVPVPTLRTVIAQLRRRGGPAVERRRPHNIAPLVASGELRAEVVDGIEYAWPADAGEAGVEPPKRNVRFLAPFDPVVWDRQRFEHLWDWPYRFEAYTPAPRRKFGYYAIPILFGDRVVGWVQATTARGPLDVHGQFVGPRPQSGTFCRGFEREVVRLAKMLEVGIGSVQS
jgi:uncharacterized protein YcaQ